MTPLAGESAEIVGLEALGWLVGHEELLPVFLGSTGVAEAELRTRAGEPEFLASVLDFILMDDAWVTQFATASGQAPEIILRARAALPGGASVNWT